MIGQLLGGIIDAAIDTAAAFFRSREAERRWMNSDRGDRPVYAPPITRHHQPWPGEGSQPAARPYRPWPGDGR